MSQRPSPRPVRAGKLLPFDRTRLIGCASLTVLALCLGAASAGAQTQSSTASASGTSASAAPQTPPTTPPATTVPVAKTPAVAPDQKGAGEAPPDETVVTITAPKPEVTHKADRDVYDVKQDPIAATGSVSDVLNNIPAVTADPDGTVSLRGNTNVQIYVNGKKQSQMQGDARAFTLQSLPGADIDSIEVLTNPPASFGSDTSGGIINVVLKRGKSLRPQSYLSVTAGDEGKGAIGGAIGKAWGPLTVTASGTFSQNSGGGGGGGGFGGGGGGGGVKSRSYSDRIRLDPNTGAVLREDETNSVNKNKSQNSRFDLNANYNINDSDSLAGSLSFNSRRGTSDNAQEIKSYDSAHNLTSARAQLIESSRPSDDMSASLTYDARGEIGTTNDFKMQWQHSQTWATSFNTTRTLYHIPTRIDSFFVRSDKTNNSVDEFSGDWSHELNKTDDHMSNVQLGWDLTHTIDTRFTYSSLNFDAGTPQVANVNAVKQFDDDQNLFAAYAIYEKQFGKLSVQGGVRFEDLKETIFSQMPLLTLPAASATKDSVNWAPSVFMMYKFTENDTLRFNYGKKLNRPRGQQLDPLIIFSADGLSARSGNPNLKAEKTDNYNLSFNHQPQYSPNQGQQGQGQGQGQAATPAPKSGFPAFGYNLDLGYSTTEGTITQVNTFLPGFPDTLLNTSENGGSSQRYTASAGINGNAFDRALNFNLNYNYNYRISSYVDPNTHLPVTRKGPTSGGNIRLRYKLNDRNSIQIAANFTGAQVDDLSRSTATSAVSLSYNYQIIPSKFLLTVNAQNVLESQARKTFNESSVQRGFSERFDPGASIMVNMRYTFGKIINGGRGQRGQGGFRNGGGQGGGGRGGGGGFGGGGGGGGRGGGGGF